MDTSYILALVAAFLSIGLFVLLIGQLTSAFFNRYAREWTLAERKSSSKVDAVIGFLKHALFVEGRKLQSIERMYSKLKLHVVRANSPVSSDEYLAQTLFEGVLILVIGGLLCFVAFGPMSMLLPLFVALAWVYFVRPSLVEADAEKRSNEIYRRIPYALDLCVLVLQAGGTLREALEIAAVGDDSMAQELRTALKEMDSGTTEGTALRNMSDRIGLEAIDSIVMAIVRGQETGAPMAQTLTTQAELFRERRLQELEKAAVEAPTKMTFPNMLVMLSVLLIIIGPVIVNISTSGML